MKKILFFLLIMLWPISVFAVSYDVEDVLIDAKVLSNGNMEVSELFVLDGTFHGYIRDIVYQNSKLKYHHPTNFSEDAIYNASGIEDVVLAAKKITSSPTFETMQESFDILTQEYESSAQNQNFVQSSIKDGNSYKMYYEANREKVAFLVRYTLKDVVVLHEDIAEVYWTFIGEASDDALEHVQIRLTIPSDDENIRVWAHGELQGNIWKTNAHEVEAEIFHLRQNSPVDVRVAFHKELVGDITKQSHENHALDSIIQVETKRADEANQIREKANLITDALLITSFIYILFLILVWIYVYIKYDKEYKTSFHLEYNREFIDDYNVEIVEYLMKKTIGENAFSASILNLVYKKNIKVEEIPTDKKKKDYVFTLLNRDHLKGAENELVDFLFQRVGKDGKFSTKDLRHYASSSKTYTSFMSTYTRWQRKALLEAKNQHFYENKAIPLFYAFLFLFLGIVIISISAFYRTELILPWVCEVLAICFVFYCAFLSKRTKYGAEHYQRWKAFRRFLEDFGNFDIKELPEVVLWERYLVYATVFGIADKVQKTMNVKIKEFGIENTAYSYYPSWIDYHIASSVHHAVRDSFTANRAAYSREIANSSFSSGSGGGGGFSSGGGFGGGGGGGRGF